MNRWLTIKMADFAVIHSNFQVSDDTLIGKNELIVIMIQHISDILPLRFYHNAYFSQTMHLCRS